jgi:autotransporter-associated beta strand protein
MIFKRSHLLLSLALFSPLLGAPAWEGTVNSDWTVAGNWIGPSAVPVAGDSPFFSNGIATTFTVDYTNLGAPSPDLSGLQFIAASTPFTITGTSPAALSFVNGANILNTGSNFLNGSLIINNTLNIFEGSVGDQLTINANISEAVAFSSLNISAGNGDVFLKGAGSTYQGTTSLNSGRLGITQNSVLGNGGLLVMNDGTTLVALDTNVDVTGRPMIVGDSVKFDTVSVANVMTINSSFGGTNLIKINPGTLVLTGTNSFIGMTVSGGILKGNTNSLPGDITNNASVIFDQAVAGTYADVMSGSGTLTKEGVGTLTLTGASSYAGGTIVNAGTLEVSADNNLGASGSTLTLNAGSTLKSGMPLTVLSNHPVILGGGIATINATNALTINSNISGSGGMSISGLLSLGGTNSYSGGTTLTAGVLTGDTDSLQGNIVNNGTAVSFNQTFNGTFAGIMSGSGILQKFGAGTLTLTGANTYSGGTNVLAGTLIGNTTSLQGNINNNASVVFDQAAAGTYTGVISGTGNFTKTNVGTLNLTNANIYTGSTSILGGTLAVNGSIDGSGVVVAPGATLAGTGTINAPVTVNGSLSPGNSIGTITSFAQVTFNNGSIFEVEISPTASDLLNVIGAGVTINSGARLNLTADPGTYSPSASYTLIHTTGGIVGTFNTLTTNSPFLNPILTYTANDLLLTLTRIDFTDVLGSGGNVGAVAACLDNSQAPSGSDMSNIIFTLMTFTDMNALRKAINQLQPSLYKGYALSQENMSLRIRSMITKRAGSLSQNDCLKSECSDCIDRGWTLWIDGLGDWSRQHNQNHQIGFHTTSGAGALGADYQVTTNFYLGLSGAYSATDIDWNGHTADGGIQSYYGTIYGTWSSDHFFIDGAIMGAHNQYTGKRHIKFANVHRHARNKHAGNEVLAHLNLGGLFQAGCLAINPFVSVDYIFLHQNGFKERGAQSLNLRVKKTRSNYVRGEAGLNFNSCFERENSRWVPGLTLGVIREWRPNGKHYSSRLAGIDCNFITTGLSPNRTLFTPGASLTALFCCNRLSVELSYDAELGSHYWDQNVNLQLGFSF